jgi:DNA-binding transcriptional ArsR family regulator
MKVIDITDIGPFIRALHCPTRWTIIEILQTGPKSSDEIFQELSRENRNLKKPTLYYHLRELEAVEIIGLDEYKPSEQGRAPEKIWKLLIEKLNINFLKKEEK